MIQLQRKYLECLFSKKLSAFNFNLNIFQIMVNNDNF